MASKFFFPAILLWVVCFGCENGADNREYIGVTDIIDTPDRNDPNAALQPGIYTTVIDSLPGAEPIGCEWEWTIRILQPHQKSVVPRRMFFSACDKTSSSPSLFTSLSLGERREPPEQDPYSGAVIHSVLDPATAKFNVVAQRHFPECVNMEGITTSADCSTIAVLCRRRYGDADYDFDALATHGAKDWMTQPDCADQELWLYEWETGDLNTEPQKVVVHRAIGTGWDYGTNNLFLGELDGTYGIGIKARVHGGDSCHEADAFLVMNRNDFTMDDSRGYSWACGTGHTIFNHFTYNPATQKYAVLCGTDWNSYGIANRASFFLTLEDRTKNEFYGSDKNVLRQKGGPNSLVPLSDGGYLAIFASTEILGLSPQDDKFFDRHVTAIGVARFNSRGKLLGKIRWIARMKDTYLSYPQLVRLGENENLVGFGRMRSLHEQSAEGLRIPQEYYFMHIDDEGNVLREAKRLAAAGWGEQDQLVSLGQGRVGWAYIPQPTLVDLTEVPPCNSHELQLTLYVSENHSES